MSYGLYDADLRYYPIPFYNLELMKLSSYYKHKREIVGLAPDFSPKRYTHFIIRQDFYSSDPLNLNHKNIEYGGRAFDGKEYKPLPLEIEVMKPDIQLYANAPFPKSKKFQGPISTMKRAEHIRLSLDGQTIWTNYDKQLRRGRGVHGIIFHDYDLNKVEGAAEFIKDNLSEWIPSQTGRRIGTKFPIQVNNKTDLLKWLHINPMGSYFSLQHNGLIDESYIPELLETRKEFSTLKQTSVNITNLFTEKELIEGGMQRILHNIINLRTKRLIFPLIYNESFFIDNNWKMVMKLIMRYNQHLVVSAGSRYFKYTEPYETLYSYAKAAIKQYRIDEPLLAKESIQSIFQFVRENNYNLFKDFYEYRGEEVR